MEQIYTISGTTIESEYLGSPLPVGVTAHDRACAEQVKPLVYGGVAAAVGSVPVGLFGLYKTLAKGNRALGVTALIGALVMYGAGKLMAVSAVRQYEACRKVL